MLSARGVLGLVTVVACVLSAVATAAVGQSFRRAGAEFNAVRSVTIPAGKSYTIVVSEFFHHGEIRDDGRNVIVTARNKQLVPMRILQLGPGDVCRLAFQTIAGQSQYDICYGGEATAEKPPAWSSREGLLLETRRFGPCDLRSVDAVRRAFSGAAPIGADYVDGVFHSHNPFDLKNEPFFSRYSGYLEIRNAGTYGLFVSSQDCSFLLIDDRVVASAPGRHGPTRRAFRGTRHDVTLSAGQHKFEYYHAAAGPQAVMVAAWEIDPLDDKPRSPSIIPPEAFHSHSVAHLPATSLVLRGVKQPPDFAVKWLGEVPLPDNEVPLVGVQFTDASLTSAAMQGAKLSWDFGDGQSSNFPIADHVYLRPGLYTVKLSVRRAGRTTEISNRVCVDRPRMTTRDRFYSFDDFLRIIETYEPKTLDAASLRQFVLVLEAKALAMTNEAQDIAWQAKAEAADPNRRPAAQNRRGQPRASVPQSLDEAARYMTAAVAAGEVAFREESTAKDNGDLLLLARLVGPMARERLGDSETAFMIWRGAARRITAAQAKAECQVEAADIAINDLLKPADAKPLLEAAKLVGGGNTGAIAAKLQRVWGDYYAAAGDGAAARKAYNEAERLGGSAKSFAERTAIRGAHARSTEEFIRKKQFSRAAEELQAWQREFATEKSDGYLMLLYARYWAARGKYAQAIAQAEQLQAVSPDSPYIDQLLLLAADSELRRGRRERALATLHSIVKDYPGSPLAPLAKKNIEVLESGPEANAR